VTGPPHAPFPALGEMLCGAGIRGIIEGVSLDLGVRRGPVPQADGTTRRRSNLQGKIEGLVEAGHATRKEADALHELRFIGNDVAHSLYRPTRRDLVIALDVIEHMLFQVFQIEATTRPLSRSRAARRSRDGQGI